MDDESLAFLLHVYRTRPCPAFTDGKCEFPDKYCLDAHGAVFKRRLPGRRVATEKCTHGFGYPTKCSPSCRKYHVMEEKIFHPEHYKSTECFHMKKGRCGPDNLLCHMYHSREDKNNGQYKATKYERIAQDLERAPPPQPLLDALREQLASKAAARQAGTSDAGDRSQRQPAGSNRESNRSPPPDRNSQRGDEQAGSQWRPRERSVAEIVYEYYTEICPQREVCNDLECFRFHRANERRRSPNHLQYMFQPCEAVYNKDAKLFAEDLSKCPEGDNCPFSHNFFEVWYHPQVFKTYMCSYEQERPGSCPFKKICSHAHSPSEQRAPESPVRPPDHRKETKNSAPPNRDRGGPPPRENQDERPRRSNRDSHSDRYRNDRGNDRDGDDRYERRDNRGGSGGGGGRRGGFGGDRERDRDRDRRDGRGRNRAPPKEDW